MDIIKFFTELCDSVHQAEFPETYVSTTGNCTYDDSGKFYGFCKPVVIREFPDEISGILAEYTAKVPPVLRAALETAKEHVSKNYKRKFMKYVTAPSFICSSIDRKTGRNRYDYRWIPTDQQTAESRDMWISLNIHRPASESGIIVGIVPERHLYMYRNQLSMELTAESLRDFVEDTDAYLQHAHNVLLDSIAKNISDEVQLLKQRKSNIMAKIDEMNQVRTSLTALHA